MFDVVFVTYLISCYMFGFYAQMELFSICLYTTVIFLMVGFCFDICKFLYAHRYNPLLVDLLLIILLLVILYFLFVHNNVHYCDDGYGARRNYLSRLLIDLELEKHTRIESELALERMRGIIPNNELPPHLRYFKNQGIEQIREQVYSVVRELKFLGVKVHYDYYNDYHFLGTRSKL